MKETSPARPDHGAYVRKVQEDTQSFAQGLIGEVERLRVRVAALESEKATLAAPGREIEAMMRVNDALRARIEGIKAETQAYSSRYAALEQQNSNLANLYVASYRLHGTLDRSEVIAAIREIIANLVGSEEAALVETRLALSRAVRSRRVAHGLTQGELARRLKSSQSRVAKMEAGDKTVSVDLLVKALFSLGARPRDVGRVLQGRGSAAA